MEIKELVMALANAPGVSGMEHTAAELAAERLAPYVDRVERSHGNVIGHLGTRSDDKPHLLLDAHIDQIGMIVTDLTEDGFLKVGNIGGLDRRLMPAQKVRIYGKETLIGTVSTLPPHLTSGKEQSVPKITDLVIDTGYSYEALSKLVVRGDFIGYDVSCKALLGDRISGAALDDRCGVAAILRMLELLQGQTLPCSVSVLFSTQEELGERGAKIGAYAIHPDIALAVDVSFGLTADDKPEECGELQKGAMIGVSPTLSRTVTHDLVAAAKAEELPYQMEVMHGLTSTNADRFSVSRGGAKACTVSIPLKYMHTPVEVISLADVENTARLLAAYVRRCGTC